MIQRNNNLSILPFYPNSKRDEMNHRRPYAYGAVYPLYTPMGSVPPFQILIPHTSKVIESCVLYDAAQLESNMAVGTDITDKLESSGLSKQDFASDGYDVIVYSAIVPMNITTKEGQHYMVLTLQDEGTQAYERYISDIFTVVADVSGMIQVQWYDQSDLIMEAGRIVYSGDYKNRLWLPTLLGKPEYDFNEEGETRDGYFFAEKMISEKRYKCIFLAPEYLCDVMRFIRLSDVVLVTDNYGNNYICDTFLITPKWQDQGDLASVEIEFTCDTVAKKIGCGYQVVMNGDFNDDFNNDFDIEDNN